MTARGGGVEPTDAAERLMKLTAFQAKRYRCLLDADVGIGDLNLFIGANASGKSTILDALRFLSEAMLERDFKGPMFSRGGMIHLAWKGADAVRVELAAQVADGDSTFEWQVRLLRREYEFDVEERVFQTHAGMPRYQLLEAVGGRGWWWSGERGENVPLSQSPTSCALSGCVVSGARSSAVRRPLGLLRSQSLPAAPRLEWR